MKKQLLLLLAGIALLPACRCRHCSKIAELERKLNDRSCPCAYTTENTASVPAAAPDQAVQEVTAQQPIANNPEPTTESVSVAVAVTVDTQHTTGAPAPQDIPAIDAENTDPDNLTNFK